LIHYKLIIQSDADLEYMHIVNAGGDPDYLLILLSNWHDWVYLYAVDYSYYIIYSIVLGRRFCSERSDAQ